MLMLMGGLGFRFGKVENVGVEGKAMGRWLHWDVPRDISNFYVGQIRCLEKNIRFVTHVFLAYVDSKSIVHKTYSFFQTAPHIYRTNYGLNKLKKHGSQIGMCLKENYPDSPSKEYSRHYSSKYLRHQNMNSNLGEEQKKKGHHVRRSPNFDPNSDKEQKKKSK